MGFFGWLTSTKMFPGCISAWKNASRNTWVKNKETPSAAKVAQSTPAASNAENELMARSEDLKISEIFANEAPRTKRFRARARGRVGRINRRSSHITVVVDEEEL